MPRDVAASPWLLHDRYDTQWRFIVPVMLVLLGTLMLVARSPKVPERRPAPDR